jgi:hypothetical protein
MLRATDQLFKSTVWLKRSPSRFSLKLWRQRKLLERREECLDNLTLGDPMAENEVQKLATYYLRTDQFNRAVRGEVNLVVGRKGSGKTALFFQVCGHVERDRDSVVLDLKPEGYQLIKLKREMLE